MNSGFECNIEQLFEQFCTMTQKEMTSALRKGLRAGAKALQTQTKSNLRGIIKKRGNTHWYDGRIQIFKDKIEDAVMLSKIKGNGYGGNADDLEIKVHIMGSRDKGSGTYRARFLEKGTKERYAQHYRDRKHQLKTYKKPKKLGSINGRWYFKAAQGSVLPTIESIYIKEIDKAIQKINNTNI